MEKIDYSRLTNSEQELLTCLPIYITVLIASADGEVDSSEISKAIRISKKIDNTKNLELQDFYQGAYQDFEDKIKLILGRLPADNKECIQLLSNQISRANDVLKKLDRTWASELYQSFKYLAKSVAGASGGFLGIGKISEDESKLIELRMLNNPVSQF